MALLPASLHGLELRTRRGGPLLTAPTRLSRLRELHVAGGGGGMVGWRAPGAAALLPKLRTLRLEAWDEVEWDD